MGVEGGKEVREPCMLVKQFMNGEGWVGERGEE